MYYFDKFRKTMNNFDPFGWIEQFMPAQWLHRIIRASMLAVVLCFLAMRIGQYHTFFFKPLWLAETLLFAVLAIAFIVRRDPVGRSRGVTEIIVPLIGSVLPFGLLTTPPSLWMSGNNTLLIMISLWMTIATIFTTWSMWILRRSFSITVEARELVTAGPYRWIRHPVYLGEVMAAFAVMIWRVSILNIMIFTLFVTIQVLRTRWEEQKLLSIFPDYRNFAERSWWFWNTSHHIVKSKKSENKPHSMVY
jgi:protein-S-isoprenylcysteine O-methyltransferase Ste14